MPNQPLKTILESDPKLIVSAPEEREIRLKYPFSNIFISFPTTNDLGVSFPAYIKGLQDNYSPEFGSVQVYGRMDNIPIYQGTSRNISLTIGMPSFNEEDARINLQKLNTIIRNLYPSYVNVGHNGTKVVNSPPLMRIKFANLIQNPFNPGQGLLGYVNGQVSINHDVNTNGLFISQEEAGDGVLLLKAYELALSMTILHEGNLGFDEEGNFLADRGFPYELRSSALNFSQGDSQGFSSNVNVENSTGGTVGGLGGTAATKKARQTKQILEGK